MAMRIVTELAGIGSKLDEESVKGLDQREVELGIGIRDLRV